MRRGRGHLVARSPPRPGCHTWPMIDLDEDGADDVGALLGESGPFARELPNFAPREAQQQMARAVAHAIAERETLIAEAGTGTGKTFAYLVPALLSGQRVIVSTGTKALQDQLFFRDLPRVRCGAGQPAEDGAAEGARELPVPVPARPDRARGQRRSSAPRRRSWRRCAAWSARTRHGDRMELAEVPEESPLWPRVTSTPENCLGVECPFYDDCHVVKARREAQEADVVVVNHHLLFADLALKQEGFGEILPGAQAFILDEAHQVPELAGQFFSRSVSARQLSELGQDALAECCGHHRRHRSAAGAGRGAADRAEAVAGGDGVAAGARRFPRAGAACGACARTCMIWAS